MFGTDIKSFAAGQEPSNQDAGRFCHYDISSSQKITSRTTILGEQRKWSAVDVLKEMIETRSLSLPNKDKI